MSCPMCETLQGLQVRILYGLPALHGMEPFRLEWPCGSH